MHNARPVRVTDFDFELPQHLIATAPAEPRDAARLLVYRRATGAIEHRTVRELPELLPRGDLMVFNDTRVCPWRLRGKRPGGGAVECLVLHLDAAPGLVVASARGTGYFRPGNKLREDMVLAMEDGSLTVQLRTRLGGGRWEFELRAREGDVHGALERVGRAPLPPYIARGADEDVARDRERYQTVFARNPGAVAAPTAGLHFTPQLLDALRGAGLEQAFVTLHVGEGTFLPVRAENVEDHVMHSEAYVLPEATARAVDAARARNGRVVAVGTTACRTLETCAMAGRRVAAGSGESRIFLHPGRELQVVDVLFTNFHLPQSTLLMLVAAMVGREEVLRVYREAVREGYRFYSFGDAMLVV